MLRRSLDRQPPATGGEGRRIQAPIAAGTLKLLEAINVPKKPIRFTAAEGAGGHCEGAVRVLYRQRVFDWLDEVLETPPRAVRE